jgi:hypothetical protein
MAKRTERPLKVEIPEAEAKPPWARAGAFAAIGLVVGIAWPSLAGMRVGPDLPGSEKDGGEEPAVEVAPALARTEPTAPTPAPTQPAGEGPIAEQQRVVIGGGDIRQCFKGRDKIEGDCGRLLLDKVLTPKLQELTSCPAALGLEGQLEVGFDIAFDDKQIKVLPGKKGELPGTTVNGIVRCVADFIRDVSLDDIQHKHSRYKVFYTLDFYPPGAALPTEGDKNAPEGESDSRRGAASVTWDTALVRAEPVDGKVVARLVRGTRVTILGRRKDWYRVKVRSKEGWVYRGALGL